MAKTKVSPVDICNEVGVDHIEWVEVMRRISRRVREDDVEVITKTIGTFYRRESKERVRVLNGVSYLAPRKLTVSLRAPNFPAEVASVLRVSISIRANRSGDDGPPVDSMEVVIPEDGQLDFRWNPVEDHQFVIQGLVVQDQPVTEDVRGNIPSPIMVSLLNNSETGRSYTDGFFNSQTRYPPGSGIDYSLASYEVGQDISDSIFMSNRVRVGGMETGFFFILDISVNQVDV